jgi:hypothetical protein
MRASLIEICCYRTLVEQAIVSGRWVVDGNLSHHCAVRELVWSRATTAPHASISTANCTFQSKTPPRWRVVFWYSSVGMVDVNRTL